MSNYSQRVPLSPASYLRISLDDLDTPSTAVLTAAMAKGDEDAWRDFHHAYFDRLFRYQVVLQRGDENLAADLVQQTLLRVVRHIRTFEHETIFWSWLTCLARCAAADAGRSRARRIRLMERFAHAQEIQRETAEQSSHRLDLLEQGLARLAAEDRVLLEAKYFDRMSYRELAEQFGTTDKAIESRLARLRQTLREALAKSFKKDLPHA